MVYQIGDKVLYPMHGAGVIEAIEEKEVFGAIQKYYVMRMPLGDMKVMVPMNNASEVGIRYIIDAQQAERVVCEFKDIVVENNQNWNKRFRDNMLKIKGGDIMEVAQVVKSLMFRDRQRGLSTGERKMLANAKQILISEIVLANGATDDEIDDTLTAVVESQISQQPLP